MNPKVVVVGAGLAGLTTAYRLHQKGVDVRVFEARPRVGGRVFTVNVNGKPSELGGKSITDGKDAVHIRALIQELGLQLECHRLSLNYTYFDGKRTFSLHELLGDRHYVPGPLKKQLEQLALQSHNMRDVLNGLFAPEDPFAKVLAVRLAAYEGLPVEQLSPRYIETLYHMLLGGISAAYPGRGEEAGAIDLMSIQGGNALLPEKMASALQSRVHLNAVLKRVSKEADGSFVLAFQNGQKVKTERVVLAIPCPVYADILLDENVLAAEKVNAIKNVVYGTNAKILVPFSQIPREKTSLVNAHMVSFFDTDCGVLTLYYTGRSGFFSQESIAKLFLQDRALFESEYGKELMPVQDPQYAQDASFSSYAGPVGYSWPNDSFAKGSYSCIAPGQEALLTHMQQEQGEWVRTLFAPVDQRLYFVGEHTSLLLEAAGTMEAACESGERAARMISCGL